MTKWRRSWPVENSEDGRNGRSDGGTGVEGVPGQEEKYFPVYLILSSAVEGRADTSVVVLEMFPLPPFLLTTLSPPRPRFAAPLRCMARQIHLVPKTPHPTPPGEGVHAHPHHDQTGPLRPSTPTSEPAGTRMSNATSPTTDLQIVIQPTTHTQSCACHRHAEPALLSTSHPHNIPPHVRGPSIDDDEHHHDLPTPGHRQPHPRQDAGRHHRVRHRQHPPRCRSHRRHRSRRRLRPHAVPALADAAGALSLAHRRQHLFAARHQALDLF